MAISPEKAAEYVEKFMASWLVHDTEVLDCTGVEADGRKLRAVFTCGKKYSGKDPKVVGLLERGIAQMRSDYPEVKPFKLVTEIRKEAGLAGNLSLKDGIERAKRFLKDLDKKRKGGALHFFFSALPHKTRPETMEICFLEANEDRGPNASEAKLARSAVQTMLKARPELRKFGCMICFAGRPEKGELYPGLFTKVLGRRRELVNKPPAAPP